MQSSFGQEIIQLHFIDTDLFVMIVNANANFKDLDTMNDFFDFSTLSKDQDLFNKNFTKIVVKIKIETRKKISLKDFFGLRSKAYSFSCGKKRKQIKRCFQKPIKETLYLKKDTIACLEENTKNNVILIL